MRQSTTCPPEGTTEAREETGPFSIPGTFFACAESFAANTAFVDGGRRITYRELAKTVSNLGRGLMALGVTPGDRVAIWAPNSWRWAAMALAVQSAGAAIIPLNTRFRSDEIAYVIKTSRPKLICLEPGFLGIDFIEILRDAFPSGIPADILTIGGHAKPGMLSFDDLAKAGRDVPTKELETRIASLGEDTVCDIMFTSGTTGHPKGVISRHGQTLRTYQLFGQIIGMRESDKQIIVNPFFHALGYKVGWLTSILFGALTFPVAQFDADKMLDIIGREQITVLPGPPTVQQTILDAAACRNDVDLGSLRLAITGATILPRRLIERMFSELGLEDIITGYGLTECSGMATITRPGDATDIVVKTSGRALPGTEVMIADGDGKALKPGEIGEVRVRGFNVTSGYLEQPDATAEAITPDGWLLTGDQGYVDEAGNLSIEGRLKEMFIVGGFNAYPAEIENTFLGHAAISDVSVIGVPDDRLGEVGIAFVVLKPEADETQKDLLDWARSRMANYKVPRSILFCDALPRNASGKVLKIELEKWAKTEAEASQ